MSKVIYNDLFEKITFIKLTFDSYEETHEYIYFAEKDNKNIERFEEIFAKEVVNCLNTNEIKTAKTYRDSDFIEKFGYGYFYNFIDFNKLHKRLEKYGIYYLNKFAKNIYLGTWTSLTKDFELEPFGVSLTDIENKINKELQNVKDKYTNSI